MVKQTYKNFAEIAKQFNIDIAGNYVWGFDGSNIGKFHGKGWEVAKEIHKSAVLLYESGCFPYNEALAYAERAIIEYHKK